LIGLFNNYEFKNISFFYGFLALFLIFLTTNTKLSAHNVTMFIYFSQKLQKNSYFAQKIFKAKNNQQKQLTPDYSFDSVLDCSGIKSDLINSRKLSVCSQI
jgi:glucan phosphoethanolaminetransferase (alkaline phosphatase superfamily)